MPTTTIPQAARTAVFLDFDNAVAGLRGPNAAAGLRGPNAVDDHTLHRRFCSDPERWLGQLATGCGAPPAGRRVLVARAYLNPGVNGRHRAPLTAAGFEVVDTPSLTRQGKSGADIRMVMDVLDVLAGPVHIDEFVMLSGDADFTPVLQRLRAHDRRTTIVSSQPLSGAYRSVADHVVDRAGLVRLLTGHEAPAVPGSPSADPVSIVLEAAARVVEARVAAEDGLAAAILGEAAAQGVHVGRSDVERVLDTFERAGLPVLCLAEPTYPALRRSFDRIVAEAA